MKRQIIGALLVALPGLCVRAELQPVASAYASARGPGRATCDAPIDGVPWGQFVTMKAVPDSNGIFVGWRRYSGDNLVPIAGYLDFTIKDVRKKTLRFFVGVWEALQAPNYDFVAEFAYKRDDILMVSEYSVGARTVYSGEKVDCQWISAMSLYSDIEVKATGLPPGLRCDKTGRVTGRPKKSKTQSYAPKFVVTNESGWSETWTFPVWVDNEGDDYDDCIYDFSLTDLKYEYKQGAALYKNIDSYGEDANPRLKVHSLPPGIKIEKDKWTTSSSSGPYRRIGFELKGTFSKPGFHWIDFEIADRVYGTRRLRRWVRVTGRTVPVDAVLVKKTQLKKLLAAASEPATLSGGGIFTSGKTYTSSVKTASGNVFAGWYLDEDLTIPATNELALATGKDGDYRIANQTWQPTMLQDRLADPESVGVTLYARVISVTEDQDFRILLKHRIDEYGEYETFDEDAFELADRWMGAEFEISTTSLSKEKTVTVTGLPRGFETTQAFGRINGFKRNLALDYPPPGTYDVEIAVENQGGSRQSRHFQLVVPPSHIAELDELGIVEEYDFKEAVSIGEAFVALTNVVGKRDWYSSALKVKGLPKGLKFNAKTGMIAGTLTTSGDYPVTITKTTTYADGYKDVSRADVTLHVAPLPKWASGIFNGGSDNGQVQLSVSKAGKINGKFFADGITYALTAQAYSGYADGSYYADVTAGWSYRDGGKTVKTNEVWTVVVSEGAVGGVVTADRFNAWQNFWAQKEWKERGKELFTTRGTVMPLEGDEYGLGVGELVTLTIKPSGAVTVKGVLDTGRIDRKGNPVYCVATGSAVVCVTADEPFEGRIFICLSPKGLPPYARCLVIPHQLR